MSVLPYNTFDSDVVVRCSCDHCGAHAATPLADSGPAGCCRNCGCRGLTAMTDSSGELMLVSAFSLLAERRRRPAGRPRQSEEDDCALMAGARAWLRNSPLGATSAPSGARLV